MENERGKTLNRGREANFGLRERQISNRERGCSQEEIEAETGGSVRDGLS